MVESDEEGPDEGEGEDYNMPYEDADQDDEGKRAFEVCLRRKHAYNV